jgi:5-methylcytosine-specific restriction enzyme subunit McrC
VSIVNIPIQNIYYLLCYAWDKLDESDIIDVRAIDTTRLIDLFAKILITGITRLLKQGLDRYYVGNEYVVLGVKGKLNLSASVKRNILSAHNTICTYDEFDHNILQNQIIRTTIHKLLRIKDIDDYLKSELHKLYIKLPQIQEIKISSIRFNQIRLHRNNYHYNFLLKVCQIINENVFIDESTGSFKFRDFIREEKSMARLFEAFVRNFYKIEQDEFTVTSEVINWNFNSNSEAERSMLPRMITDISLLSPTRKIIIDTKYYKEPFRLKYSKDKINSSHLYQLYSYIKNQETSSDISKKCEGILLYPSVGEDFEFYYYFENHLIKVISINLGQDWMNIRNDLMRNISLS